MDVENYNIQEVNVYKEIFNWCYDFEFKEDDIVLNIWWNLGYFDLRASNKVKHIYTYEPSVSNYNRLIEHLKTNWVKNVTAYNMAISNVEWQIPFYESALSILSSTALKWPRTETTCNAILLENVLKQHEFTKIKCDIEWAEYDIFTCDIPKSVEEIILETHILDGELKPKHDELLEYFRRQWFDIAERQWDDKSVYIVKCKRWNYQS